MSGGRKAKQAVSVQSHQKYEREKTNMHVYGTKHRVRLNFCTLAESESAAVSDVNGIGLVDAQCGIEALPVRDGGWRIPPSTEQAAAVLTTSVCEADYAIPDEAASGD